MAWSTGTCLTVPRRDGLVVQSFAGGEMQGYGDTNEAPDRSRGRAGGADAGRTVYEERLKRIAANTPTSTTAPATYTTVEPI